jgi:hypothetical protein
MLGLDRARFQLLLGTHRGCSTILRTPNTVIENPTSAERPPAYGTVETERFLAGFYYVGSVAKPEQP